jgi:assimilatory nitrate reductase catalytic subunit
MTPAPLPMAAATWRGARDETRFFAEGASTTPDGKARFIAVEPAICDRTDADYPFTLNTGRIRDQWHTMTRTGKSARLSSHIAEPFAEIHPRDALEIGVGKAALVEIESPFGKSIVRGPDHRATGARQRLRADALER